MTRKDLNLLDKHLYASGAHLLPNGNIVLSVFRGRPQFIEVSPDKKIISTFYRKSLDKVSSLCILDGQGNPEQGEVLR